MMKSMLLNTIALGIAIGGSAAIAQFGGGGPNWEEGWIDLGVHNPDFGWQAIGEAKWTQDENKLVSDGKPGWLFTTTEWGDFELEIDFRPIDAGANSGVFIRSTLHPTDPTSDCYEVNIAPPENAFPSGSLVARQRRNEPTPDELVSKNPNADDWRRLRIVADGGLIQVFLAGQLVTDYEDSAPRAKGHIGLQSNGGRVEFKNVRLRPIGAEPIFNGKNLDGWNTKLAGPAKIEVTEDGELQVLGGPGQLESDGEYGDFVMQFECKVNGDGLNSGVFFRSIPGDKMNGYECQIQNQYEDGDRTKPVDCGTGGIYRRINARLVNANDREWFGVTLQASGSHIAVWVNGVQVTDWTDTRKPDENPRRGLRLKPGTFCIQAHDPTTDLLFRNIRLVELP